MLLANPADLRGVKLSGDTGRGHITTAKVRYQPRVTPEMIQETDDCKIDHIPAWLEEEVPVDCFNKFAIFIPMDTIRQYAQAASDLQSTGDPTTSIMMEFWDAIIHAASGIIAKMDQTLLTKQVTNFGINVVTGSNAAQAVNIPQDATINDLTTGITKILADASENEFIGGIDIVGSGIMNNYQLQQIVKGLDSAGVDTSRFTGYSWYHDLHAANRWGANQVGVFERGAVQFLDVVRYTGNFAGIHGGNWLGTIDVPTTALNGEGQIQTVTLDAMLKFNDCPTDVPVLDFTTGSTYYEDGPGDDQYVNQTVNQGYYLILSKKYGLFPRPFDMFRTADRMAGSNGALRYALSNT